MSYNLHNQNIIHVNTGDTTSDALIHSEFIQPNYRYGPTGAKGPPGEVEDAIGWTGMTGSAGGIGPTGPIGLPGDKYSTRIISNTDDFNSIAPGHEVTYYVDTGLHYTMGQEVKVVFQDAFNDHFIAEILEYKASTGRLRLLSLVATGGGLYYNSVYINLYGEIGKQGPTGPTGIFPQGPIGEIGITGSIGLTGLDGSGGPMGPPTGPTGDTGPIGSTGNVGGVGAVGPTGSMGIGATGPIGSTGPQGPQDTSIPNNPGPAGVTGVVGNIGDTGATGPQGLANFTMGPQGPLGPQGPNPIGPTGPMGITGPTGAVGVGPTGPQGQANSVVGAMGPKGSLGPIGLVGATGLPTAPAGPVGPVGPTGLSEASFISKFSTNYISLPAVGAQISYQIDSYRSYTLGQNVVVSNDGHDANGVHSGYAHRFYGDVASYDVSNGDITLNCTSVFPLSNSQGVLFEDWVINNNSLIEKQLSGPAGPDGSIGNVGSTGLLGSAGSTGSQGPIGITGPIGVLGPVGASNQAGPTGAVGNMGPTGPVGVMYNPYEKTQYSHNVYSDYSDLYVRSGALHAGDYILIDSVSQPTKQSFRRGLFHDTKYYQIASDSSFNNILVDSRKRICQNEYFFSENLSFDTTYYVRFDGGAVGYAFNDNAFKFIHEQGKIPVVIAGSVHPATHPYNIILSSKDDKLYATSNGWFDPVKNSSSNYLLSFSPEYDAQGVPNEATRIDIEGTGAAGLEFCPVNEDIYIANFASNNVIIASYLSPADINVSQRKSIEVGQNPVDITYSPSTNKMYVFHSGEASIKSIDPMNFDQVKNIIHSNILLGGNYGVYCPSNQKIYITNPINDNLMCFDPLTESVELMDVKSHSNKGVYCPYNDRIYITHSTDNIISVINPQENVVEATVVEGVKEGVHGIAYSPVINKVFVTNHDNDLNSQGTASYLNPETNAFDGHMDLGVYPNDIVCDISRAGIMWTTNYGTDNLYFIRNI